MVPLIQYAPSVLFNFLIENADGELEEDAEPDEDLLEEDMNLDLDLFLRRFHLES